VLKLDQQRDTKRLISSRHLLVSEHFVMEFPTPSATQLKQCANLLFTWNQIELLK